MNHLAGSSAAAAAPQSEELAQRLRSTLPAQLDQMEHGLWCARMALSGPDPEAALVYLTALADRIRQAVDLSPGATGTPLLGLSFPKIGRAHV